jgi:hypothetical protein
LTPRQVEAKRLVLIHPSQRTQSNKPARIFFRQFLSHSRLHAINAYVIINSIDQPEHAMAQTNHPSKELVRDWMRQRQGEHRPPPTLDEIRRQLGWELVEAERATNEPREQRFD